MFRGSMKGTGYPIYSPVSLLLPLPCITVCHHISTGLYMFISILSTESEVVHGSTKVNEKHVESATCVPLNTLRTGPFKLFKRPFPGFLTTLTL